MSEGDYPFIVITLDGTPDVLIDKLLELAGKQKGTKVEVLTVDQFFRNMTRLSSNPSPEQEQTVKRFLTLQEVLQEELSEIEVYLVGEIEIDAFILGKSADGGYAGLRTKVIQT